MTFTNKNQFLEKLNQDNKKNNYLLHLIEVSSSIQKIFKDLNIVIDPLEKSTFDYHHGLTFTIFSKSLQGSIAKGGTYKTINEEDATGISLYVDLLGGIKNIFLEKEKVLVEQNDFKSAEKLIKKGYKILLDLLYISNQRVRVIDVNINFDNRMKGKSKMNLKILFNLISMISKKFFSRVFL